MAAALFLSVSFRSGNIKVPFSGVWIIPALPKALMYTMWRVMSQTGIYVLLNGLFLAPTLITPSVMDSTAFGPGSNVLFQIYKTV